MWQLADWLTDRRRTARDGDGHVTLSDGESDRSGRYSSKKEGCVAVSETYSGEVKNGVVVFDEVTLPFAGGD